MNIYQNGEFSKNLHKLTKYQSLAATVNDMSKQSLYSRKVQEYRNKLDKVSGVQTGGVTKDEIISKINTLVPNGWKRAFGDLKTAHENFAIEFNNLQTLVGIKIEEINKHKANEQELLDLLNAEASKPKAQANPQVQASAAALAQTQAALAAATAAAIAARETGNKDAIARAEADAERLRQELIKMRSDLYNLLEQNSLLTATNATRAAELKAASTENERLKGEMEQLRVALQEALKKGSGSSDINEKCQSMLNDIYGALTNVERNNDPPTSIDSIIGPTQTALSSLKLLLK